MLALAGYPLALRFRFLDPAPGAPAGDLAEVLTGNYDDPDLRGRFCDSLDVVTYEFENVPVHAAQALAVRLPVYPPVRALEVSQDRLIEKQFLQGLGIPTPAFRAIATQAELSAALRELGYPAVLKTRRMGYDGKGQVILRRAEDVDAAWHALSALPLILEQYIAFEREVSLLAVCNTQRDVAYYPLVVNQHREGILRLSVPIVQPTPQDRQAQSAAHDYARRVLDALNYVGVLAIEFFEVGGRLLANEMAPRVHNSGHWTIEGAHTSQFENHLRAICGLPLGSTQPSGYSAMLNLIGQTPSTEQVLAVPSAHLHLYGKAPRPGRKLGHITIHATSAEERQQALSALAPLAAL
jgi:5-(carboxyamino)imidazole ribonucleotide synthase